MITRINKYLLTHYPLLWNTRVAWVLPFNLLLHLVYFLAGYASVQPERMNRFFDVRAVTNGGDYMFSILTSILVLIVWLVYYLRNNALKHGYPLPKGYLAGETCILFLILFSTITYINSFDAGVRSKVRSITNEGTFKTETKTVNQAMAFIPMNIEDYFILNNCNRPKDSWITYDKTVDYSAPTGVYYTDSLHRAIRTALERPDAFSYRHFCKFKFTAGGADENNLPIFATNANWIAQHRADSIQALLFRALDICRKYGVEYQLSVPMLQTSVFADANNKPGIIISGSLYDFEQRNERYSGYFYDYGLRNAFNLVEESHTSFFDSNERISALLTELYVTVGFGLFFLCYRRFSRRVMLVSIVGAIVIAILIGLISFTVFPFMGEDAFPTLFLVMFIGFGGSALILLKQQVRKTTTGVLFTWHVYLLPFLMMIFMAFARHYYRSFDDQYPNDLAGMQERDHPVSYWIMTHGTELLYVWLPLMLLYLLFLWTPWAKKWQAIPEE